MELVTSVRADRLIRLSAPEFAALVPVAGAADLLFQAAFGARLGQARDLKTVGALWLAVRHRAMPETEREEFPEAIKCSVEGMLTATHLVSWVPFHLSEQRVFALFGPAAATVVSLMDEGFLEIKGLGTSMAIDGLARTVSESAASRFVVTATDLTGRKRAMAWQDDVFFSDSDAGGGGQTELVATPRQDAAKRIAESLAAMLAEERMARIKGTRS